jgi:hypothetical protein
MICLPTVVAKKADTKMVEMRKAMTDDEIKKYIVDRVAKKETLVKIRIHLQEEKEVDESRLNDILVELVRVNNFM